MPVRRTSARLFGSTAATVALAAAGLVAPATSAFAAPALSIEPAAPVAGSSFTVKVANLTADTTYRLALTSTINTDRTDVSESNSCSATVTATSSTLSRTCTVTENTPGNYDLKLVDSNNVLLANQAVTINSVVSIPTASQPRIGDNPGANDIVTITNIPHVKWTVGVTPVTFAEGQTAQDVAITSAASTNTIVTATADAGYVFADGTNKWQRTYRTTNAATVPATLATPTAPVVNDQPGTANDSVTLSKIANVTWVVNGEPISFGANETSKTITAANDKDTGQLNIKALAADGHYFAGNSPEYHFDYTLTDTRAEPARERVAGSNRFETANAIAAKYFPNTTETVYVANGLNFPDALSAGPAAARASSPLLLTMPDSLPASVEAQLRRLQPKTINVVGGPDVVSSAVEAQLERIAPVTRLEGRNRYTTAEDVSRKWSTSGTVYIAFGGNFPDALSGGSGAAGEGAPLLLSQRDSMLPSTITRLRELNPKKVVLVGGTDVLTTNVARQVGETLTGEEIVRADGTNRYDTSAKIIENVTGKPADKITTAFLATGLNFPDALAGVPAAKVVGAPLALSLPRCLPNSVKTEFDKLPKLDTVVRLGGSDVIADFPLTNTCN